MFKFSFDTSSNEEANDETMIHMDFMSFLKKPCQNDENNLDELKQHPFAQKLFIRYNSIISSAAALERSVPLAGLCSANFKCFFFVVALAIKYSSKNCKILLNLFRFDSQISIRTV